MIVSGSSVLSRLKNLFAGNERYASGDSVQGYVMNHLIYCGAAIH